MPTLPLPSLPGWRYAPRIPLQGYGAHPVPAASPTAIVGDASTVKRGTVTMSAHSDHSSLAAGLYGWQLLEQLQSTAADTAAAAQSAAQVATQVAALTAAIGANLRTFAAAQDAAIVATDCAVVAQDAVRQASTVGELRDAAGRYLPLLQSNADKAADAAVKAGDAAARSQRTVGESRGADVYASRP